MIIRKQRYALDQQFATQTQKKDRDHNSGAPAGIRTPNQQIMSLGRRVILRSTVF